MLGCLPVQFYVCLTQLCTPVSPRSLLPSGIKITALRLPVYLIFAPGCTGAIIDFYCFFTDIVVIYT
nr:MAG TPA: hypothetical protein [Bacteriophage sp.]